MSNNKTAKKPEELRNYKNYTMETTHHNKVSVSIKAISMMYLACIFIVSMFFIFNTEENTLVTGILVIIIGGISTIFIYALGEIIQILHDIRRNLYKIE